ncbi:MAG: hypothetical protein VYE77_01855 [Planctomycetota bacterium]|nr:hypothetical protein [Planctomycetota bacterium]
MILLATACSRGGSGPDPAPANGGNAELVEVHSGRLVNVLGLVRSGGALEARPYLNSVLIGPDIRDEVGDASIGSTEPRYDFLTPEEATLQPRLLILREIGTPEFDAAFDALDDRAPRMTPALATDSNARFSIVARNAGLRLRFSRDLGIDQAFFTSMDENGTPIAVQNAEGVQLLEIGGTNSAGESLLRPIPARIECRGQIVMVDPVLLGNETRVWNGPSSAAGLPAAPNQTGANIRLALPLSGPLAIPGLREDRFRSLIARDLFGRDAIVRDFRSGHPADDTPLLANGFIRESTQPQLIGHLPMRLAKVHQSSGSTVEVEIFKNGIEHEIDSGDSIRFEAMQAGQSVLHTEVLTDPVDDRFDPARQSVRVRVRSTPGLLARDPRSMPGYPSDPSEVEGWLDEHGPVATLVAPFQASRTDPETSRVSLDDPRWFVQFTPDSLNPDALFPTDDVAVFGSALLRFSKPMDMDSLRPLDTLFFATRDVATPAALEAARIELGIDPASFQVAKFRTPHRIGSRILDTDGSQTVVRTQPLLGFYLDEQMRDAAAAGQPFEYFLHLIAGGEGLTDLSGQPLDLDADDPELAQAVVIPFDLDARVVGGRPTQSDNLVVYSSSSFEADDEDERPSYYLADERVNPQAPTVNAQVIRDLYGNHVLLEGSLHGRPTSRVRAVVDDVNQGTAPAQSTVFRWCYEAAAQPVPSALTRFNQGIQNPFNPFGSRVQMLWREIDMGLSRTAPQDMDLDIEQMFWAPLSTGVVSFDIFDSTSLFLGHSEKRPEPCVGNFSALPNLPDSGLFGRFEQNYVWNPSLSGMDVDSQPAPHSAYIGQSVTIAPTMAITEPTGTYRYLPLPEFQKPYFVWRDQTVKEQGGELGQTFLDASDTAVRRLLLRPNPGFPDGAWSPYILSPWMNGRGDAVRSVPAPPGEPPGLQIVRGRWNNGSNRRLQSRGLRDSATGGLLGSIALPLLADFQTLCDEVDLPLANPFRAAGVNGWQVSFAVQSDPMPAFRAYSGGRPTFGAGELCIGPGSAQWANATGGFDLNGQPLPGRDNTIYWAMIDLLKRQTVTTSGFIDLEDPHRVPVNFADPRLRPQIPTGFLPEFLWEFGPLQQPVGTSVAFEFRAAGDVDPQPWQWREDNVLSSQDLYTRPDRRNVVMDPLKACDAHIRKFDDRGGRNDWSHFYHGVVTDYVEDPNDLFTVPFTQQYATAIDPFGPHDVRYINWRLRMSNAVDADPPVSPRVDALMLAWRWTAR